MGQPAQRSNKLYRKVTHRYRPNLFPRQRPTAKTRPDQAALTASAEARGTTHRARPRSSSSTDSTRSTHFTLTQRHRWKETDGKVCRACSSKEQKIPVRRVTPIVISHFVFVFCLGSSSASSTLLVSSTFSTWTHQIRIHSKPGKLPMRELIEFFSSDLCFSVMFV